MSKSTSHNRTRLSASRVAAWTLLCQIAMQLSGVVTGCRLARIVGLTLILAIITELGRCVMTGREDYTPVNWVRVSQRVLSMAGYVICWLTVGFTLTGAVVVNVLVALVLCIYVLLYLVRGQRNAWRPDFREMARLQRYGIKVLPSTLVHMANLRLDQ